MTDRVIDGALRVLVGTGVAVWLGLLGAGLYWLWRNPRVVKVAAAGSVGIALLVALYRWQPAFVTTASIALGSIAVVLGGVAVAFYGFVYVSNRPTLAMIVIAALTGGLGLSLVVLAKSSISP